MFRKTKLNVRAADVLKHDEFDFSGYKAIIVNCTPETYNQTMVRFVLQGQSFKDVHRILLDNDYLLKITRHK